MENVKAPGPEDSFVEILDAAISVDQSKDRVNDFFPLRPSAAGHCARKLAYDLTEYRGFNKYKKEQMDPNVVRLLDLGHGVEYSVFKKFDLCKNFKVKYKQQVVSLFKLPDVEGVEQELIEGSIDAIFYSPEWKGVIDIKSAKDKFSVQFQTKWDETLAKYDSMQSLVKISENGWWAPDLEKFLEEVNDIFLADNFIQLNSYLFSEFCQMRGVTFGSIIKYCKNDSRMYEIRFSPSQNLFNYVCNKFSAVNSIVTKEKAPDNVRREYIFGSMRCAFCPYNTTCWENGDALKAWFKTFPKKKWPVDSDRFIAGDEIESLFQSYHEVEASEASRKKLESAIVKIMLDEGADKIKLASGYVYMLKSLKDGIYLRKTKL